MKSITIHKLDDSLLRVLEERARREGVSMNRLVKCLLTSAVGLDRPPETDHREDFLDLFGTWSEEEDARCHERIKDLERIEPGDWAS